jgi:hypothetical protein
VASIPCFLSERTQFYRRSVRRYTDRQNCPSNFGYHNANIDIDVVIAPDEEVEWEGSSLDEFLPLSDPRWPKQCEHCPYQFAEIDIRQWNQNRLYRRPGTDELFTLREAPVGAMWYADWMSSWHGPDGRCLVVMTPGGEWVIDGPSNGSNGKPGVWTRSGKPPVISVSPSIIAGNYHGWLKDGVLID